MNPDPDLRTRAGLARAITLVESTRPNDRAATRDLLAGLAPPEEPAVRVAISGVPGVGKSTLIETLGLRLIAAGHRIGVLAVDPSSARTGGSVLGDKTRMPRLSLEPDAFVRPSPTSGTLGGVARSTAQTIPLLEAAGYDVIVVETVGVGQSEIAVADLVDTTVLLVLSRSGDQLQGIKKGVLEVADIVAVNKADGEHVTAARMAARELTGALRLVRGRDGGPEVMTCSAATGTGVDELWHAVQRHRRSFNVDGLMEKRAGQQTTLAWALVRDELDRRLMVSPSVRTARAAAEFRVRQGTMTATEAADLLLAAFDAPV